MENILIGTVISECFSQHKDELIIRFETHTKSFYIKASLSPSFSCLSFPNDFQRARKNSIDLFPEMIGHRVMQIRQFNNERSFALILDNDKSLLFKMYGNWSNVILFNRNVVVALFNNSLPSDKTLQLNGLDRTIDWSFETFRLHEENPQKLYFTFGKLVWQYLQTKDFDLKSTEDKWESVQSVLTILNSPSYSIALINARVHLSLLTFGTTVKQLDDPLSAINEFYHYFTHDFTLAKEKNKLLSILKGKLQGSENYHSKNRSKLAEIESDTNYKTWADLLMANLHAIAPGSEEVTLPNFYNNDYPAEIKLKKDLSPQKNAAIFYKKGKNQHIEITRLQETLTEKEREIERLKQEIDETESITDLRTLRKKSQSLGYTAEHEKQAETLPYHEFIHQGFKIRVGKNAKSNDELTLRHTHKEDLWLHAKDVSGSHVVIKYQSGKNFPKDVIERAAQLAAYNSKRKTESLCPVLYTPKKFVRKRKGDPPGAMIVEREQVILVEPRL